MIRGVDNIGALFIGLTRAEMDRLLAGERICSNPLRPHAPGPHLCIFGAEDQEELEQRLKAAYPSGPMPPVVDARGVEALNTHPKGRT